MTRILRKNVNVYKSINRPEGTSSVEGNTQLSCCCSHFQNLRLIRKKSKLQEMKWLNQRMS